MTPRHHGESLPHEPFDTEAEEATEFYMGKLDIAALRAAADGV